MVCVGREKTGFWWGNPKDCFEGRGMYERKSLKWIFKQTGWEDLDWINLAWGMVQWWALQDSIMILSVQLHEGSISTS
jgi:hypothetical protein